MQAFDLTQAIRQRHDPQTFRARTKVHLRRWWLAYLVAAVAAALFQACFTLGINMSPSLPHRLYLIHMGAMPTRGDLVAFRWAGGGPYPAGVTFVKILHGMPGDAVTRIGRDFFVNGDAVGTAKPFSRTGTPLEPGAAGILPPDRYYVRAPHPDSLDSRYALTGWITREQIIGRAYVLF
jgi:conjugal transfer pilin signal peptidase TrbI